MQGPRCALQTRLLFHCAHKSGQEDKLMKCHQQLGDTLEDQLSLASIHYLRGHYQVSEGCTCSDQALSIRAPQQRAVPLREPFGPHRHLSPLLQREIITQQPQNTCLQTFHGYHPCFRATSRAAKTRACVFGGFKGGRAASLLRFLLGHNNVMCIVHSSTKKESTTCATWCM